MIDNPLAAEILELNQRLLDSIVTGDWSLYESLCSPDVTCFEPETLGNLVEGMAFHKFYFDLGPGQGSKNVTMATPHVRLLGDETAIVAYTRLVQQTEADGTPVTKRVAETRVWQRVNQLWKLMHIHRSPAA